MRAVAVLASDREDGHRQGCLLALLILREGLIQRPIEPEAAGEDIGPGQEAHVVSDRVIRGLTALNLELVAEEDVLPSLNELFGERFGTAKRDVPEPVVDRGRNEYWRRCGAHRRPRYFGKGDAIDTVRMIRREGVSDG